MEILNITEKEIIEGMGGMEQLRNVEKQLMLCECDMNDEQLDGIKELGTMVLNSPNITEKGVKKRLEVRSVHGHIFTVKSFYISPAQPFRPRLVKIQARIVEDCILRFLLRLKTVF